ncbi:MAG: hypothetical protein DGJ47_000890 [Rickettsiaceae bacterium]
MSKEYNTIGCNIKNIVTVGGIICSSFMLTEYVFAAGELNIDESVTAMMDPLTAAIKKHWMKIVAMFGIGAAIMGEGDMRQRAFRAGGGVIASSAVVLALIAML